MGKYFGTDGFRGEAGRVLTPEKAYRIGRYLGWYFAKEDRPAAILIGMDTRISGDMLESALTAGITASGGLVYPLSITTTPSVAYLVRSEEFDCGIMISASHNPFYDNGIKLINREGHKMEAEVEEAIEAYIDGCGPEIPYASREKIGSVVFFNDGVRLYCEYLKNVPTVSFEGKKIVLDCANGSASVCADVIFRALGAETVVINDQCDGLNINVDCGSTHPEGLLKAVLDHGADMGFAFDGDADRCLAADEKGHLIDGDRILYICGKALSAKGELPENVIVSTVMSNIGFYKACAQAGLSSHKTAVGDKYVSEEMVRGGYALGGEQSGHIIFGKYATTGDGILTALMLLQTVIESGKKASELAEEVRIYPQLLVNVRVTDKKAAQENEAVQAMIAQKEKELGESGRILVRPSGTEPLIRVMAEAETSEVCEDVTGAIVAVMKAEGLVTA